MRATQFIAGAFTLAVAALSLPVMSNPVKFTRRDVFIPPPPPTSKCNEGGGLVLCSDATTVCQQVPVEVEIDKIGGTAQILASNGSATVWLTRAKLSATFGNATALCLQIVGECCNNSTGSTMSKGEIPLPFGRGDQTGSIQIVPSGSFLRWVISGIDWICLRLIPFNS